MQKVKYHPDQSEAGAAADRAGDSRLVWIRDGTRKDGAHEQVWHCVPFSEGAQYGIELFYPVRQRTACIDGAKRAGCILKATGAKRRRAAFSGLRFGISAKAFTRTNFYWI